MATERLPMRKIREILRQKWVLGHRHRAIARALGIGVGTVSEMTRAARQELWRTQEPPERVVNEARDEERERHRSHQTILSSPLNPIHCAGGCRGEPFSVRD